jgi:hypothetical protein
MIPVSNIQSNKLERLSKLLLIQHLNEKPLVFVRFEDMPEHTFCIVDGKYIASRESVIAYFFTHFFQTVASPRHGERLNTESTEMCALIRNGDVAEDWWMKNAYFANCWDLVMKMKEKYDPKEVLGWTLEKNVKVI